MSVIDTPTFWDRRRQELRALMRFVFPWTTRGHAVGRGITPTRPAGRPTVWIPRTPRDVELLG